MVVRLAPLAVYLGSVVVSQVTNDPGSVVLQWVQYGVLGGVVVCMMFGLLVPKPTLDRVLADKQRAEDQRDALTASFQSTVIPALVEFNRTAETLLPLLQAAISTREPGRERGRDGGGRDSRD